MIAAYLISGVCFLIAACAAHGIFHWLRLANTMSRWPTVPGTITSTWDTLKTGKIEYNYTVGSHSYLGRRIHAKPQASGPSTMDRSPQELTETYPPGATVTVYYDPKLPKNAVLEPRNRQNLAASIMVMVGFGYFGAIWLAAWLLRS